MSTLPLRIAPSILSADFTRLGEEIEALDRAGADVLHIDIMDGHFVPNISFGPLVVEAMRKRTKKLFDVHLMIAPVDPYIAAFAQAGADRITAHVEAGPHIHRTLQAIRAAGCRAGVALNPGTPVAAVAPVLDLVDLVLVMSVNPGFGGQSFIPESLGRIAAVRELIGTRAIEIEVDGGIGPDNAGAIARAGATTLVAGSSVLGGNDPSTYADRIAALRKAATTLLA
jgi:ribulose-phosphate 3-epimerase